MVWSGAYGYADLTEKRVMTMNTVCSAVWNDFGRLKFTIINQATLAVTIITGVLFLLTAWQSFQILRGVLQGSLQWAPLTPGPWISRALRMLIGLGVSAGLVWGADQPYLFLRSSPERSVGWPQGCCF